jgi:hypothetical protein
VFEFDTDEKVKMHLVDCPGYQDSFGFYRTITNRFFYYQVFSKVQNVKFIITFPFADLRRGAEIMKKTFKQFLNGFHNLNEIKEQIFNATNVMVTAVPKDRNLESVRKTYSNTTTGIGDDTLN